MPRLTIEVFTWTLPLVNYTMRRMPDPIHVLCDEPFPLKNYQAILCTHFSNQRSTIYTREIAPGGGFHRPNPVETAPGGYFPGICDFDFMSIFF